jgi:hypothetical protein
MTIGTQVVEELGNVIRYTNTTTEDNEEALVTGDVSRHNVFMLMSVTGAVDVLASLDGTNFSTSPLSLVDQGATDAAPVLLTAAARVYGFRGKFRKLKVLQNGATGVAVTLLCGTM